jgi:hypothetical protein
MQEKQLGSNAGSVTEHSRNPNRSKTGAAKSDLPREAKKFIARVKAWMDRFCSSGPSGFVFDFFESPHQKSKIIKKSSKIGMNMNMIKNPLTIIMIIHHPILTIHHLQHLATVEAGVRRAKSSSPSTTRKKAVLVSSDSR